MRIGQYSFKRRYSLAQILVDIFSAAALGYMAVMIYFCAADIERLKALNRTDADMSVFDWRPLVIWLAAGIAVCGFSVFLILKKKKLPKRYVVNRENVRKYCNIIDVCIALSRLMILIALCEVCYLHMTAIMMIKTGFSMQLVYDALILAGILVITHLRLLAISEGQQPDSPSSQGTGAEGSGNGERKSRDIIQD